MQSRTHRFYKPMQYSEGQLILNDEALAKQIGRVLQLHVGESIKLFDGNNQEALAAITEIGKDYVKLDIQSVADKTLSIRPVILYCAVLKHDHFELVVQKATEIGVAEVVPVLSARVVKQNLRVDRLTKIAIEAAEQCGRSDVPKISEPISLEEALKRANENCQRVVAFDESGEAIDASAWCDGRVGIFIGPEGGWSEEELSSFRKQKIFIAKLGQLIFRGETAAIIASYLATAAIK